MISAPIEERCPTRRPGSSRSLQPKRSRVAVLVVVHVATVATTMIAQDDPAAAVKKVADTGWNLRAEFQALYEDNVFGLSEDSLDRLSEDRASDEISGRYDDMNSAYDLILTTELEWQRKITDSDDDDFRIEPGLRFLAYTENPKKSHPEFFLEMQQEFLSGSTLELDLEYEKDVFARNYLADATDLVGDVSSSERRYEEGIYDDWSASASFEQRLWKSSADRRAVAGALGIRRVDLDATVGVGRRWYYVPFSNRDRDRVFASLELKAEFGKGWSATVGYAFDRVRTDNGREVLIRDEDEFDMDFNLDGDRVDQDVRAFESVDRSRNEQELGVGLTWDFAKHWSAEIGGSVRVQDYLSDEPVDDTHRDRVDRGRALSLDLEWEFRDHWTASLVAGVVREDSNRNSAADADDEEAAYNNFYVGVGATAKF